MDVIARVDVIEQVPSEVVGVFIDHEIIAAIPAPIGEQGPIPGSHFKVKSPGKPEPVAVRINAKDVVAVLGAKALEMPMIKRMIQAKARVIRPIMSIPLVMVHMGSIVDPSVA